MCVCGLLIFHFVCCIYIYIGLSAYRCCRCSSYIIVTICTISCLLLSLLYLSCLYMLTVYVFLFLVFSRFSVGLLDLRLGGASRHAEGAVEVLPG